MAIYDYTGAVETVTITTTGVYELEAVGAMGGGQPIQHEAGLLGGGGGDGADVSGTAFLEAGTVLEIVVGEAGFGSGYGSGGGGGSFVYDETAGILLEAAGGGGGNADNADEGGGDASLTTAGGVGGGSFGGGYGGSYAGAAANGEGGNVETYDISGGGGGIDGSGEAGVNAAGAGGMGGDIAPGSTSSSAGGVALPGAGGGGNGSSGLAPGGFGGGGAGGGNARYAIFGGGGGGGGGFTGGNGGNFQGGGGGGGSYANASLTNINIVLATPTSTGNGSITITELTPCFLPGTRIRTEAGEIAVEDLAVGDRVRVHTGGSRPVTWVGRREVATAAHPNPADVMPVLIAAGAISRGVPARDLWVSPDHALYLDGHLIPARSLTNGATIRQVARPCVTYLHVELDAHSLIWAEGILTESFLECGNNRAAFGGGAVRQLHPSFAGGGGTQAERLARSCAPFADNGPVVHEVRRRLLLQADIPMTRDPDFSIAYTNGAAILRSRIAIPGETELDPGDKRRLGVKLASLSIGGQPVPLDHPQLTQGWHSPEPDGRWTDGAALIPATLLAGQTDVTVTLAWTTLYPLHGEHTEPAKTLRAHRA